jgi:hypothetical protein
MNGKFNIDLESMTKAIFEEGQRDRMVLTEMQEEQFRKAAEILAQNKKDCEKLNLKHRINVDGLVNKINLYEDLNWDLKNPNPDWGGTIPPMTEMEIESWADGIFDRCKNGII